jgi:hypothetical protein
MIKHMFQLQQATIIKRIFQVQHVRISKQGGNIETTLALAWPHNPAKF